SDRQEGGRSRQRAAGVCARSQGMAAAKRSGMRHLLPSILLVAAAACGTTTRFIATNTAPHPMTPKPAEAVAVFTTGQTDVPYVEVGIIQGRQTSTVSFDEMPEIIATMRTEAGGAGRDAL